MKKHLAIFSKSAIAQLFAGKKTIETRFSRHKIAPFAEVSVGDVVYIKPPGEAVVGQFLVAKVLFLEGIDRKDWDLLKTHYGDKISLGSKEEDAKYFINKETSRFATIIFIDQLEKFITSPIKISKQDRRGWVVLGAI